MDSSPFGGPEIIIIIILLILGLWWFLAFLPGKIAATTWILLASFSLAPQQAPAPVKQPIAERTEFLLL